MKKPLFTVLVLTCFVPMSFSAAADEKLSPAHEKAGALKQSADTMKDSDGSPLPNEPVSEEPGHDLGGVTGTNIDMKVYDHAVAGAINGGVAWGFFDEAAGAARLTMRKYGQVISAGFKKQADGSLGGVISSADGDAQRTTSIFLGKVDGANKKFTMKLNGEEITVAITAEGMNGGHFVNPTYSTVIAGKPVSYRIEVEGCFGYSINMAMIMIGAYAH